MIFSKYIKFIFLTALFCSGINLFTNTATGKSRRLTSSSVTRKSPCSRAYQKFHSTAVTGRAKLNNLVAVLSRNITKLGCGLCIVALLYGSYDELVAMSQQSGISDSLLDTLKQDFAWLIDLYNYIEPDQVAEASSRACFKAIHASSACKNVLCGSVAAMVSSLNTSCAEVLGKTGDCADFVFNPATMCS